jgi:hypothetical protein
MRSQHNILIIFFFSLLYIYYFKSFYHWNSILTIDRLMPFQTILEINFTIIKFSL